MEFRLATSPPPPRVLRRSLASQTTRLRGIFTSWPRRRRDLPSLTIASADRGRGLGAVDCHGSWPQVGGCRLPRIVAAGRGLSIDRADPRTATRPAECSVPASTREVSTETCRGAAAATTWMVRGDGATTWIVRGDGATTWIVRGDGATTWIFRGDGSSKTKFGAAVGTARRLRPPPVWRGPACSDPSISRDRLTGLPVCS